MKKQNKYIFIHTDTSVSSEFTKLDSGMPSPLEVTFLIDSNNHQQTKK